MRFQRAQGQPLRDAVLFESFAGKMVGDNPKGIHDELVSRGTSLEILWTVNRPDLPVPEGARAVLHGSPEWLEGPGHQPVPGEQHELPALLPQGCGPGVLPDVAWHTAQTPGARHASGLDQRRLPGPVRPRGSGMGLPGGRKRVQCRDPQPGLRVSRADPQGWLSAQRPPGHDRAARAPGDPRAPRRPEPGRAAPSLRPDLAREPPHDVGPVRAREPPRPEQPAARRMAAGVPGAFAHARSPRRVDRRWGAGCDAISRCDRPAHRRRRPAHGLQLADVRLRGDRQAHPVPRPRPGPLPRIPWLLPRFRG